VYATDPAAVQRAAEAIYQLAILICGMSLAGFQHRCNIQMG
jgi:hypothetical protein